MCNNNFLGVPRVAVVDRFDCILCYCLKQNHAIGIGLHVFRNLVVWDLLTYYSQTCRNNLLQTMTNCQQQPVWYNNNQSKSHFYQEARLSNGHFFQVPRVVDVPRFYNLVIVISFPQSQSDSLNAFTVFALWNKTLSFYYYICLTFLTSSLIANLENESN